MKKHTQNASETSASGTELEESEQVELLASILEILGSDEPFSEVKKMALICTGWLAYGADMGGELRDLWKVMDAAGAVGKIQAKAAEDRLLVKEVKSLLE